MDDRHAFVLMSGGFDSTVVALFYFVHGYRIHPVKISYDSRQIEPENKALSKIIDLFKFESITSIDVNLINTSTLSKNSSPDMVEEGDYKDFTSVSTVVPGRNLAFIAALSNVAEAFALSNNIESVIAALGIHKSDWAMYPDCRSSFFYMAKNTVRAGTDGRVILTAPAIDLEKKDIPKLLFHKINNHILDKDKIEYFLSLTYSCYRGGDIHCGTCPTCKERHDAFISYFGKDSTIYLHNPDGE